MRKTNKLKSESSSDEEITIMRTMTSPVQNIPSRTNSTKVISKSSSKNKFSNEKCENKSLDIMNDLILGNLSTNILKIKSLPNNISDFPRVNSYIRQLRPEYATVFKFKFFNICSWMLFSIQTDLNAQENLTRTENLATLQRLSEGKDPIRLEQDELIGKILEFTWIIDDESFMGNGINCLKILLEEQKTKLENIATTGFNIPVLIMNGRTYTQSAVPILLGLNLIAKLGLSEVYLTDIASNTLTCQVRDVTLRNVEFFILDQRIMTCSYSIYAKYDFLPVILQGENLLCQITLQNILDDYIPRLNHILALESHLKKTLGTKYYTIQIEFGRQVQTAKKVIEILMEEPDYSITIKEWIEQFSIEDRNCQVVLLKNLLDNYLCTEFTYKTVKYPIPRFKLQYDLQKENSFVNRNVLFTVTRIYKNGLTSIRS